MKQLYFILAMIARLVTSSALNVECSVEVANFEYKCLLPAFRQLTSFPLKNSTKKLDLSGNNLLMILNSSFMCPPLLEVLNLNDNKLRWLEKGAFHSCRSLKQLLMKGNDVSALDDHVLDSLSVLETLDLADNQLFAIPRLKGLHNLRRIDLSRNRIVHLTEHAFQGNLMLAELRISGNLIHSLPEFLFPVDDVTSYRRLDLSSNQLLTVPQVVREMTGLKYLVLSSNPVKIFHRRDFSVLEELEELILSDVGIESFPALVFPFPNLKMLDIGENYLKGGSLSNIVFPNLKKLIVKGNIIGTLPSNAFIGTNKLQELDLSDSEISNVDFQTFQQIPDLEDLNLQGNLLTGIPPLSKNSKLKKLNLNHNKITSIHKEDMRLLLKLQHLEINYNLLKSFHVVIDDEAVLLNFLDISANRIEDLNDVITNLSSLVHLNASRNFVENLRDSQFSELQQLLELDLHGNQLTKLSSRSFKGLSQLCRLHLHDNKISAISDGAFAALSQLKELSLGGNRLLTISAHLFHGTDLQRLSLPGNKLHEVAEDAMQCLPNLEELNLSNNQLMKFPDLSKNPKLLRLNLSYNPNIGDLTDRTLQGPSHLQQLILANTGLQRFNLRSSIKSLQVLDLSANHLESLPTTVFGCPNLQELEISRNPISYLPVSNFSCLLHLQIMHLDFMRLNSYDVIKLFSTLPALRIFSMSGNPWSCGCESKDFLLGFDESKFGIKIERKEQLMCTTPMKLKDRHFDSLLPEDFQQCEESKLMELGATTAIISLAYLDDLVDDYPEIHNRIWYVPLSGGTEKVVVADQKKRLVTQ